MPTYNPLTSRVADQLAQIVGPDHLSYGDAAALEPFSRDETPDYRLAHMPEAVVHPASADEVAEILRLASVEQVPITPRGGGTGLAGGAIPVCGGIVLVLNRMNRMIDLDERNLMAVMEPGLVTRRINDISAPAGLCYAGYPMSYEDCHIGGNIATNAGGAKAIKYGMTGRYVSGLDVVLADGRQLSLGGRLVKNATDGVMLSMLIGSEGILGIITKIVLRLLPLPPVNVDLLATFATIDEAAAAVPKVVRGTGIIPCAVELMDRAAFVLGSEYVKQPSPAPSVKAALLISLDGLDDATVRKQAQIVRDFCLAQGAMDVEIAADPARSEAIWSIRRSIGSACNAQAKFQGDEDIVVPVSAIPALVSVYHELGRKYGLTMPAYGHAGDGNIHVHIFPAADWTTSQWDNAMDTLLPDLYSRVRKLGGKISGEHGIGCKRRKYLSLAVSEGYIQAMSAVKRALDPKNILNPNKVLTF